MNTVRTGRMAGDCLGSWGDVVPHCELGSQQPRGISLTQPGLEPGPYVRATGAGGWFA
jgi:hypothetical protein